MIFSLSEFLKQDECAQFFTEWRVGIQYLITAFIQRRFKVSSYSKIPRQERSMMDTISRNIK